MRCGSTSVILVCLLLATALAGAQEQTAAIEGVVRDESGGVIAGVSVLAVHVSGLRVHAVTDDGGRYRFPTLPAGRFELSAELPGLAPARIEYVELRLGQRLDVPITLDRAVLSETISVATEVSEKEQKILTMLFLFRKQVIVTDYGFT